MKVKIRKGDKVEVISGKDKHHRGEVIKVLPKDSKVVVQGANIRRKHQSQVQAAGRNLKPGIIEFEGPMDISNVMLVCPNCDETTRVGIRRSPEGAARFCKQCNEIIDK